ncbi:MAG: low molecular weight protein arginine phosphatase [Limnochordales bacterium]|nr:low molecular weight protein arginine phosphatase [Limnochordales bacterium]
MGAAAYRILLICTGNTCRSSMAEVYLRHLLQERGVTGVEVTSAGLAAFEGAPATPQAVQVMKEEGLDLASHRAHRLAAADVMRADLILTMTSDQKRALLGQYPQASGRVFALLEYAEGKDLGPLLLRLHLLEQLEEARRKQKPEAAEHRVEEQGVPGGGDESEDEREKRELQAQLAVYDIEDPIGGDLEVYRKTARKIRTALEQVVSRLTRELEGKGKKESG